MTTFEISPDGCELGKGGWQRTDGAGVAVDVAAVFDVGVTVGGRLAFVGIGVGGKTVGGVLGVVGEGPTLGADVAFANAGAVGALPVALGCTGAVGGSVGGAGLFVCVGSGVSKATCVGDLSLDVSRFVT